MNDKRSLNESLSRLQHWVAARLFARSSSLNLQAVEQSRTEKGTNQLTRKDLVFSHSSILNEKTQL